jgi:hypothetical protein
LVRQRERALRRTAAALVLLVVLLGVPPVPLNSVHQAVEQDRELSRLIGLAGRTE